MKKLTFELTTFDLKEISGGGLYEVGYSFGRYCANAFDFYKGIYDGIFQ
ncbi:hypothetical protein ACRTDU_15070 [Sunxiuqinia elliptica]|uniref:Uncharacterized protein n=1 Tax=Sunxiuqinia elliptica TaxID=655355 RepID=A0A1I2BR46_9BACT|nr:hypothetical protein [Sunxiuqinia elliptica]SFE58555.1 hypothetical protein SAMN05216283_101489 [Sunxiuqinia elliptica]